MEKEKKTRGPSLQTQLQRALADAELLQKADRAKRGESYISEMKLVTARILTLQRVLHRKENSSLKPLKDENATLKRDIASLKVEIETLKQRPAGPVTPVAGRPGGVAPTNDRLKELVAASDRMLEEMRASAKPKIEPAPRMAPAVSGIPEHLSDRVTLTPPREEKKSDTAAWDQAAPRRQYAC